MNELHKHPQSADDSEPKNRKRRRLVAGSLAALLASGMAAGCSPFEGSNPRAATETAASQENTDTPQEEVPEFGSQGELGQLESRAVELVESTQTIIDQVSEILPSGATQRSFEDNGYEIVPESTVSLTYYIDEHNTSFGAITFEDFRELDTIDRDRLDINFRILGAGSAADLTLESLREGLDDGGIIIDVVHSVSPESMSVAVLDESGKVKSIEYQEFNGDRSWDRPVVEFDEDRNAEYEDPELAIRAYSQFIGALSTSTEGSIAQQIARSHNAARLVA